MKNKYMKIQILAIAVLLLGTLTASAIKDPNALHFRFNIKQGEWSDVTGEGTNDGRWHVTGTFVDAGTMEDEYVMQYEGEGEERHMVGMISEYTMTGRKGDLTIVVTLGPPEMIGPSIMFDGIWEIIAGTGDYATVEGSGTATQIIHLRAAMSSGEYGIGGPSTVVHVTLEEVIVS